MRKIILLAILGAVAAGVYSKLRAKPAKTPLPTVPTKPTLVTKPTLSGESSPGGGAADTPAPLTVVADVTDASTSDKAATS